MISNTDLAKAWSLYKAEAQTKDSVAETSSIFHTIIETSNMQGYSAQKYYEEFFTQIIDGRRNYESLAPATKGINQQLKK